MEDIIKGAVTLFLACCLIGCCLLWLLPFWHGFLAGLAAYIAVKLTRFEKE